MYQVKNMIFRNTSRMLFNILNFKDFFNSAQWLFDELIPIQLSLQVGVMMCYITTF